MPKILASELAHVATASPHAVRIRLTSDRSRLVTPAQAALITGIGLRSLEVYRSSGRLSPSVRRGRKCLYQVGALLQYIESRWTR